MPDYTTENIRNIALVGHGSAGKTTLGEAMLLKAGCISALGDVTKGSTVLDFEPEEKTHQNSLAASVANLSHDGTQFNLIDTPGYPDFLGRALSVLPAVEAAAIVIDAKAGVQMNTRRMMQAAQELGLCRMIVINKIDTDEADLESTLAQVIDAFGSECMPINLPTNGGKGVVDCFFEPSDATTDFSSVTEAHTQIVDQVVEMDEDLMELYLEQGQELASERLHDVFEQALREGHLIPVCFTSATQDVGVDALMDIIARVMPSPLEGNRRTFVRDDDAIELEPAADSPVVAHVFKVAIDAFVGKLGVFRIHQGTLSKDSQLYVGEARKPFKVGHLYKLQGKDHTEIDKGVPGDVCAVTKVEDIHYDSILREGADDVTLAVEPVALPKPMFGLAIETKNRGDEQKLSDALSKLSAEDPCFRVEHNAVLNETVIRGLGDLHLRIVLEKMKERYNVEVETRVPRIEYRETIRKPAEGHHRHKKQTGGAGQFGEVYLRVEPLERGDGFQFVDKVVGGVIPNQYIPAVEKGIRQVLDDGAVAGYPMQDVRVTIYDGKHHPVDSKEIAFVAAGKKAFIDAIGKANPIILEPVVDIDITVPQDNMGDITGDLSSKRGRINGTEALAGGMVTVSGSAPLSELASYQSELKSVTGGAGSYTMALSHYDPVPSNIQQALASEYNPNLDDD